MSSWIYSERVVDSFEHQIHYAYYGYNPPVSIEGIVLEHSSAPTQIKTATTQQARTIHDVFHPFLFNNSKQDTTTTTAHRKHIISLLKRRYILSDKLNKIWKNTDFCCEH